VIHPFFVFFPYLSANLKLTDKKFYF